MSFAKKLLDLLTTDWGRDGRERIEAPGDVTVVRETTITIKSSGGREMALPQEALEALATKLGVSISEVQERLEHSTVEDAADLLGGSVSATTRRVAKPSLRMECQECDRTVAFGGGTCVYCGAELELPERAAETGARTGVEGRTLQEEVDARYVGDEAEAEGESTEEEEQASFLRRITRM